MQNNTNNVAMEISIPRSSILMWQLWQNVSGSKCVICVGVLLSESEFDVLGSDSAPSGGDFERAFELALGRRL